MPSSRRLRLTQEARDDLRDLLQYTFETWGRNQCDTYRALIRRTLRELAQYPGLGRKREELGADLRSFPAGQHVVIYLLNDQELVVTRIMHSGMDIEDDLYG
ncbi:MAG: type II toxin-antitoxin system RelE/ParE family toxin [Thermomicrobiales bacterium]